MGAAGRPGRGERARVAARVRELVGASERDPSADEARPAWVPGMRLPARHDAPETGGWRQRLRWDPGRRGVLALGLAVVVVLAATGWWLATKRPTAMPIEASGEAPSVAVPASASALPDALAPPAADSSFAGPSASAPASTAASAAASTPASPSASASTVVVDVAGKVRRPGVYTLPAGARVYDAVRAAGGPRRGASTTALNLAAPLQDGEQIVVGAPSGATGGVVPGGVVPATSGAAAGSGVPGAPVDLNTATLEQLEALPGIGPVLGQNILDWRAAHGQFSSVDQLQDVSGIGPAKFGELKGVVSV